MILLRRDAHTARDTGCTYKPKAAPAHVTQAHVRLAVQLPAARLPPPEALLSLHSPSRDITPSPPRSTVETRSRILMRLVPLFEAPTTSILYTHGACDASHGPLGFHGRSPVHQACTADSSVLKDSKARTHDSRRTSTTITLRAPWEEISHGRAIMPPACMVTAGGPVGLAQD